MYMPVNATSSPGLANECLKKYVLPMAYIFFMTLYVNENDPITNAVSIFEIRTFV